jgi:hypothetical protein
VGSGCGLGREGVFLDPHLLVQLRHLPGLENDGWVVVAIQNEDLDDSVVMEYYRLKITKALG